MTHDGIDQMKKRWVLVLLVLVGLPAAFAAFWFSSAREKFADDEYHRALIAQDGDRDALARDMFEEACLWGSKSACWYAGAYAESDRQASVARKK